MKEKSINEAKACVGRKNQADLWTTHVTDWELAGSPAVLPPTSAVQRKGPSGIYDWP